MFRQLLGGPLLTAAVLAAALGVSFARRRDEKRRQQQAETAERDAAGAAVATGAAAASGTGKYYAPLSAEAVKLLVATAPLPYRLVDVRPEAEAREAPLPVELAMAAVALPEQKLAAALTLPAAWAAAAAAADGPSSAAPPAGALAGPPTQQHLLVFLDGAGEGRAQRAAAVAAALGLDRTAVVAGGLAGYVRGGGTAAAGDAAASIGRDALAALLGRVSLPPPPPPPPPSAGPAAAALLQSLDAAAAIGLDGDPEEEAAAVAAALAAAGGGAAEGGAWGWQLPRVTLLDVRRHDERTLYGAITGALHVPADELPSALALPPAEFARRYRSEPPRRAATLVVHSRTTGRAYWAAQVAVDAGYSRPLVLRGGAYSWRADGVKPYAAYQPWDPPPEPEPLPPEPLDPSEALGELLALGLATPGASGSGGAAAA